jgi:hypothetical protein
MNPVDSETRIAMLARTSRYLVVSQYSLLAKYIVVVVVSIKGEKFIQ